MDSIIPKRIIQTGKNMDLPLMAKAAVANMKLLNPDFEYMYFDDAGVEDFMNSQNPEYRRIFDAFRFPIQRYDFFRYLAVYYHGGFYFDLDVFLASGLEELLSDGCVFSFEELNTNVFLRQEYGMDWGIGNYAFGAAAGHPFIHAIIQNCIRAQQDPKWSEMMMRSIPKLFQGEIYVLNTTGPGLIARTLAEYPNSAAQVKVLFPDNVCDRTTWSCFGSYGVHLMEGSWRKRKGAFRRRLYNIWLSRMEKKLYEKSERIGKIRSCDFKKVRES